MAPHSSPDQSLLLCDPSLIVMTCIDCRVERLVKKSRGKYSPRCDVCRRRYQANRARTRREDGRWVKLDRREYNLKRVHGLTGDAFIRMAANGCWVCGSFERLCVDHDHKTGLIRGILCDPCNVALGRVDDDPDRLHALAWYLEGQMAHTDGKLFR